MSDFTVGKHGSKEFVVTHRHDSAFGLVDNTITLTTQLTSPAHARAIATALTEWADRQEADQ